MAAGPYYIAAQETSSTTAPLVLRDVAAVAERCLLRHRLAKCECASTFIARHIAMAVLPRSARLAVSKYVTILTP